MKKLKRITALVGVILLIALYAGTMLLGIFGSEKTMDLLFVAIICTVIIPVLLWAYSFIYRLLKENFNVFKNEEKDKEKGELNGEKKNSETEEKSSEANGKSRSAEEKDQKKNSESRSGRKKK